MYHTPESQWPTHHKGRIDIKVTTTNAAPRPIVENFHLPSGRIVTTNKTKFCEGFIYRLMISSQKEHIIESDINCLSTYDFSRSINSYCTSIGWYCAADSNVIGVIAIMDTPCPTCAVSKSVGSIRTWESVQPNLTISLTIVSTTVEGIGFSVKWVELKGEWKTNNFKITIPQNTFVGRICVVAGVDPKATWKTYRYPNCRQTISAAYWSKLSSHTVPQLPLWNTSTRPLEKWVPFTRRKSGIQAV